jgi:hypothetical protein
MIYPVPQMSCDCFEEAIYYFVWDEVEKSMRISDVGFDKEA